MDTGRSRLLQHLRVHGRHALYRLDPYPVRYQPRPLLRHLSTVPIPRNGERSAGLEAQRRRLGVLGVRRLCADPRRLEHGRRISTELGRAGQVRVSAERRLRAGHRRRNLLPSAGRHVHRLLQDSARLAETGA